MKFLRNRSINQINLIGNIVGVFFITLFGMVIIYQEYNYFSQEIKRAEDDYIKSQKELIVKETHRALRYINYMYELYKNSDKNITLKELQDDIVDVIEQMRDERNGEGYVFIYTFDGINIADPILKQNAGVNLINFRDPNGKRVIKELIDISSNGGFVEYVWNKPQKNILAPKISYAKSFEPFRWMVGSGVYLDSINEVIKKLRVEHYIKMERFLLEIFALILLMVISTTVVSHIISKFIKNEKRQIINFFTNASRNHELINIDKLNFKEFKTLSFFANEMVKEINEKQIHLEELNSTLEYRVAQKTEKLKEQNIELENSKKMLEETLNMQDKFIKNAIHEINTPLSIILTNIDLAIIKNGRNRYLTNIESGSKIIHNIYSDLSYSIKKDRLEYKKHVMNFSNFLLERIEFFRDIAIGNHLEFKLQIEDNLFILFNEIELQRIIDNNLSNAIKFSFPNSEIEIKLEELDNQIIFEIKNFGEQIKNLDLLFQRFYRENEARGGFGLGLSLVKEICDKNSVHITVKSENSIIVFRYFFEKYLG